MNRNEIGRIIYGLNDWSLSDEKEKEVLHNLKEEGSIFSPNDDDFLRIHLLTLVKISPI